MAHDWIFLSRLKDRYNFDINGVPVVYLIKDKLRVVNHTQEIVYNKYVSNMHMIEYESTVSDYYEFKVTFK